MSKSTLYTLFIFAFTLLGCQNDLYKFGSKFSVPKKSKEAPLVQFIIDGSLYDNTQETLNLSKALEYAKLPYKSVSVDTYNEQLIISPSTRVVSVYETIGLNDRAVDSLLAFVAKGGNLHISKTLLDPRLHYFMGLKPEADISIDKTAKGFHFNKPVFPGKKGFTYADNTSHLGFERTNFTDAIEVLVSASNNAEYPVLYEHSIGKGKVIVLNTGASFQKNKRGFVFASIISGLEGIPYPVANVASLFLDDYPSAHLQQPIGLKTLKQQWWPAMSTLAKRQNLQYAAFVTFSGNKTVEPPYGFSDSEENTQGIRNDHTEISLAKEILKTNHELGYHGYNHVPLLAPDWRRAENMLNAHRTAEKRWKFSGLDKPPISYVPPQNKIDSVGLRKLGEGMSSLRFFQSSFLGDYQTGGNREFDPEPWNNRFFDFPRVSGGFTITPLTEWDIESLYLYSGIWSHYINEEHLKKWQAAPNSIDAFDAYLSDYKNRHPYARFLKASEASTLTIDWRYAVYNHTISDGLYEVESYNTRNKKGPNFWLMYVSREKESFMDEALQNETLQVEKTPFLQGSLYSIKTATPSVSVLNIGNTNLLFLEEDAVVLAYVFQDRKQYKNLKNSSQSFEEKLVRHDVDNQLDMAVSLIEDYLRVNPTVNEDLLLKYAGFRKRQGKEKELWQLLDDFYLKNPSAKKAFVSNKISKIVPFPNKKIQKLWLERQLKWHTPNEQVLLSYLANFSTPENARQVKAVKTRLYTDFPSPENTANFLYYLIETEDKALIEELDKISPCSIENIELATTIAKTYGQNLVYDKALAWHPCTANIADTTVAQWKTHLNNLSTIKQTDFDAYIALLLANDKETAIQELAIITPCEPGLQSQAYNITMLYAAKRDYEQALAWSACTEDIAPIEKMNWYFELGKMEKLKSYYASYTQKTPNNHFVHQHMANLLLYNGEIIEALTTIKHLPLADIDPKFKQAVNKEVREASPEIQEDAFKLFIKVLDPITRKKIQKFKRQKEGSALGVHIDNTRDLFDPISTSAGLFYEFYNKKGNSHRCTITQGSMLSFDLENLIPENTGKDLLGLEYAYTLRPKEDVFYTLRGRLERDSDNNLFGHIGALYSKTNAENALQLALEASPVQNGLGYGLNLYRIAFRGLTKWKLHTDVTQHLFIDGNYYTDTQADAMATTRIAYHLMGMNGFSLNPIVEVAASIGSIESRNGYPYWMANNRLFAGAGMQLMLGKKDATFNLDTHVAYFMEQNQENFQRYVGTLSYKVSDYTKVAAGFQVYTIDNFFANSFQLGFNYKFK